MEEGRERGREIDSVRLQIILSFHREGTSWKEYRLGSQTDQDSKVESVSDIVNCRDFRHGFHMHEYSFLLCKIGILIAPCW